MGVPTMHLKDPSDCNIHHAKGPSETCSADVKINGVGVVRTYDIGHYPSCCDESPTEWHAVEGHATVKVNKEKILGYGCGTLHPHVKGHMVQGSANVFVGGNVVSVLEEARQDAIVLVDKALESIDRWNEDDRKRFKEWFGDDSEEVRQQMREKYLKVRERLQTNEILATSGSEFAHVHKDDSSKVWLGQAYWPAPRTGEDSKAGTLVHETSHYGDTADTADRAYGRPGARQLAIKSPKDAQSNADTMEYFAETAP